MYFTLQARFFPPLQREVNFFGTYAIRAVPPWKALENSLSPGVRLKSHGKTEPLSQYHVLHVASEVFSSLAT
jgi:hypothetical protein